MGAAFGEDEDTLIGLPQTGRVFHGRQRVRLGDIDPVGRLRLDAVARYLQDVANDDAYDSGIANPAEWVVRRTVVEIRRSAVLREDLDLATFCSGTGASWAERRTVIRGELGAEIDAASLWIQVDAASGRPARLTPDFAAVYGPSAGGRVVRARLRLTEDVPDEATDRPFAVRRADLDVMGHVNNAVYWAMLEEVLDDAERAAVPVRIELEHHRALDGQDSPVLRRAGDRLWVCAGSTVVAAARWRYGVQPTSR